MKTKKLLLSRETVRELTGAELEEADGGVSILPGPSIPSTGPLITHRLCDALLTRPPVPPISRVCLKLTPWPTKY